MYAAVRVMADSLLAARGADQVGLNWPANFVKCTDSLTTRFNRAYDRQRALCEDPVLIRSWFELVEQTKAKYGICDEDVYNFDEAGFMMGKIREESRGKGYTAWKLRVDDSDPGNQRCWLGYPCCSVECSENKVLCIV
jgi:hypothetical protein